MNYNQLVLDCFFSLKHGGFIETCPPETYLVSYKSSSQDERVLIALYLNCSKEGLIKEIKFKAKGPPYVIAAMEWLCREINQGFIGGLPDIHYSHVVTALDIPQIHYPIALKVIEVYKKALSLVKEKLNSNSFTTM